MLTIASSPVLDSPDYENIFVSAWKNGYILKGDLEALRGRAGTEEEQVTIARLLYAIRRGHIALYDDPSQLPK